jgi:serine protease Do
MKLLFSLTGIFLCVLISVIEPAAQEGSKEKLYPVPRNEMEEIIKDWLVCSGYEVSRFMTTRDCIQIKAGLKNGFLNIELKTHSPLATKVCATAAQNNRTDEEHSDALWNYLDRYFNQPAIMHTRAEGDVPAEVLSKFEAVVCIECRQVESVVHFSGFVVDRAGLILCTYKYLRGIDEVVVYLNDGRELKGRIVKADYDRDLAIVDVDSDFETIVSLNDEMSFLEVGKNIYAIGCPDYSGGAISSGFINSPPRLVNGQPLWQANLAIYPGSSGSPVFDSQGRFAAILKDSHRGSDSVGFLIPHVTIINFIKDW